MAKTNPDVFILETLHPDDEGNGRFEGSSISHILRLHGKKPIYSYVRTRFEFENAIREFGSSKYRYLHISAHGEPEGLCTTNQDEIDYDELADLLQPHLEGKRLFLSTCSMVHDEMAKEIIPKTKCFSVVGPKDDIAFSAAAVFWPSIYHLIFSENISAMRHIGLKRILSHATKLFDVNVGYFTKNKKLKKGYKEIIL